MDAGLKFIGEAAVYLGGATAIGYGLFLFLGKRWIASKFNERLELSRHEHAKELEKLKVDVNALFNRLTRLQDKEFDVIAELWSRLNDANLKLARFVSLFQAYPDLEKMSDERLEEFLEQSTLFESERNEIRKTSTKNDRYQELIFGHESYDVKETYLDFHLYFTKNRIFLKKELAAPLTEIDNKMWDVLQRRSIGKQIGDQKEWVRASKKMQEEIQPALDEIETSVQRALNREMT